MGYGVACVVSDVEDETISTAGVVRATGDESFGLRNPTCRLEEVGKKLAMCVVQFIGIPEMYARNDEDMCRSLRIDIAKRVALVGGDHFFGWDLSCDDPAENTAGIHLQQHRTITSKASLCAGLGPQEDTP